jgi:hypothetical protein|nr:MAG TPA: hypothetical protein [Caudoviricetes sp.]
MNTTEKLERIVAINENIIERYKWLEENYNKLQAGWEQVLEEGKVLSLEDVEGWNRLSKKIDLLDEAETILKRERQLIKELEELTKI